jgi:HlyD family secretion protein
MSVRRFRMPALWFAAMLVLAAVVVASVLLPGRRRATGPGLAAASGSAGLAERGGVPVAAVVRRDFVRQVPAEGNLRAVVSTRINAPMSEDGAMRIAWIADDGSEVAAGAPLVRFDPSEIEKTLADGEADLASARLKADKERSNDRTAITKLERDAAMAERELASARQFQKKDATLFSRHDIVESEIDQGLAVEKQRVARAQEVASKAQEQAGLGLLAVDIRKAEAKIRRARASLQAIAVTAPHAGIFILQHDMSPEPPHVGDTVWPGQALAEIPDLSRMQAEVYVLEADAGGLAAGEAATVQVDADPGTQLPARVARVASVPKPRLRGSPVQYFEVDLKLTGAAGAAPPAHALKPGERVSAVLRLAERRGALVAPREAVFERDGGPVVYRWRAPASDFEAVPVTLGPSGTAVAVLDGGVATGDLLALRDPTRPAAAGAPAPAAAAGGTRSGAAAASPAGVLPAAGQDRL